MNGACLSDGRQWTNDDINGLVMNNLYIGLPLILVELVCNYTNINVIWVGYTSSKNPCINLSFLYIRLLCIDSFNIGINIEENC